MPLCAAWCHARRPRRCGPRGIGILLSGGKKTLSFQNRLILVEKREHRHEDSSLSGHVGVITRLRMYLSFIPGAWVLKAHNKKRFHASWDCSHGTTLLARLAPQVRVTTVSLSIQLSYSSKVLEVLDCLVQSSFRVSGAGYSGFRVS
jgi:hypothetical protein